MLSLRFLVFVETKTKYPRYVCVMLIGRQNWKTIILSCVAICYKGQWRRKYQHIVVYASIEGRITVWSFRWNSLRERLNFSCWTFYCNLSTFRSKGNKKIPPNRHFLCTAMQQFLWRSSSNAHFILTCKIYLFIFIFCLFI